MEEPLRSWGDVESVGVLSNWPKEHKTCKDKGYEEIKGNIRLQHILMVRIEVEQLVAVSGQQSIKEEGEGSYNEMLYCILDANCLLEIGANQTFIVYVVLVCIVEV